MRLTKYKFLFFLPFVFVSLNISIISLIGYFSDNSLYYRPLQLRPALNPLTAVVIILLGLVMFLVQVRNKSGLF